MEVREEEGSAVEEGCLAGCFLEMFCLIVHPYNDLERKRKPSITGRCPYSCTVDAKAPCSTLWSPRCHTSPSASHHDDKMQLARCSSRALGARTFARAMSTKPLKSGTWIDKELGYDT